MTWKFYRPVVHGVAGPHAVSAPCSPITGTRDDDGVGPGFAGLLWQFPENNFGPGGGFPIPAGATEVSFWAWGRDGGARGSTL